MPTDQPSERVQQAAALLAEARRTGVRIPLLPPSCRPETIQQAQAVQDVVTQRLAQDIAAYKASLPKPDTAHPHPPAVRAPIYGTLTYASPAQVPVTLVPQCGVEAEVAFRFHRSLPHRPQPYSADEVAAAVEACAAIEAVTSRFADPDAASYLDKLADCVSNGAFVHGPTITDWHKLDLAAIEVTLCVDGDEVVSQRGGHPGGDPFPVVIAFVEAMRQAGRGIDAGLFVTCGSYTGLRYLTPGARCRAIFQGLGSAELRFVT